MQPSSSDRNVRSLRKKRGTPHKKNHRWESFTEKVAKLHSLDPLRKVRLPNLDAEDLSPTTSYFKNGLEKWRGLSICEGFKRFARDVTPMCESLPQMLYFEDKIMDLLASQIEMKQKESLEPLLNLLAHFAHDLGVRFEKHYQRALTLVISTAGTQQDIDVTEWCFTCLAFMFKYLHKLLVLDLRPTYDLISPLLGKERQPPYITRFAAEALSFLVKKAAAPAVRKQALDIITCHAKSDLIRTAGTRGYDVYCGALMTMFSEAIKGSGQNIHSSGTAILQNMFSQFEEADCLGPQSPWGNVICGVLTSLVHHTNPDTFKDIVSAVIEHSDTVTRTFAIAPTKRNYRSLIVAVRSLGVVAGVRKGSRISNWTVLMKAVSQVLDILSKDTDCILTYGYDVQSQQCIVLTSTAVLQYAPMESVIPLISGFMNTLADGPLADWFLVFSSFLAQTNMERFQALVLPYFQRFIMTHWSGANNENALCLLIPKMVSLGALAAHSDGGRFSLPQSSQDQILSEFERLDISPFSGQAPPSYDNDLKVLYGRCLTKCYAYLEIFDHVLVHPPTASRIMEILLKKLKLALTPTLCLSPAETYLIVGESFNALARMDKCYGVIDQSLASLLHAAAPRYSRLPIFLEAMLEYETRHRTAVETEGFSKLNVHANDVDTNLFITSLVENLCTESHELRLLSLKLLDTLQRKSTTSNSEVIATMLLIEQTPLDLQTVRSTSMHIRKLALMYQHHTADIILRKAVPYFCFGLLTVKLAQIWEDASAALSQIAESIPGEKVVADLAFHWLEAPSATVNGPSGNIEREQNSLGLTEFECSNLIKLNDLLRKIESEIRNPEGLITQRFEAGQKEVAPRPSIARTQALKVLLSIPHVAEKRSRLFVPKLLSWAIRENVSAEGSDDMCIRISNWSRKDQKAQLSLLCLFRNPRALYKSEDIHSSLLVLLASGDLEIQNLALKALFTWKFTYLRPYEENLRNLLDEARFNDEITTLLHDQSLIQPEHRKELMPVLLRLLYGRMISGKGSSSGKRRIGARRLTVLRSLNVVDTEGFLDIALGELKVKLNPDVQLQDTIFETEIINIRKQLGFINMIEDVIKELGKEVAPFTMGILPAILYCLVFVSRRLQRLTEGNEEGISQVSNFKSIRQTGLKCLTLLFTNNPDFDWSLFMPPILKELINPRLDKLPIETAQGVSGLLQLLSSWSKSSKTILLLGQDDRILQKVAECLATPKSKNEVKLFVLGIINNVTSISRDALDAEDLKTQIKFNLLDVHMDTFLTQIGNLLRTQQELDKEILDACVETVSGLAPFVSQSREARNVIDISVLLLNQSSKRVDPKTKSNLLAVLEHFVQLYDLQGDHNLRDRLYNTIASLFGFFRDRTSRAALSRVLQVYALANPQISEVAALCADLNSFVDGKLDEPDYDRRLIAFRSVVEQRDNSFTAHQWRPLLYNMLYYIRCDEEYGILSSNSCEGICSFLNDVNRGTDYAVLSKFQTMLSSIILPAIYSGVREKSELVRREYLKVMAHIIRTFPNWTAVNDMQSLLCGNDELEASFFNNVLAAGKGRQFNALGQLADAARRGELHGRNVANVFIPLLEHFIFDRAEGSDGHNLAAEATITIGVLVSLLEWRQYRALLRKYIGCITSNIGLEKQIIKLVAKVVDSLAFAAGNRDNIPEKDNDEYQMQVVERPDSLAATLTEAELAEDLTNIISPLFSYLHDRDESSVSLRVPVAVIIVKLLKLLPQEQLVERLPPVVMDICHILRSKAPESRDMARDTLAKICTLLGPSYFGFVLKELRGTLTRGYHLHILSYTLHTILVAMTPEFSPGDLDYCLPSIVEIIIDDIFGVTGQEKEAEGYSNKMKEVKSSKSHDSMELMARTTTLSHLIDLIRPIRALLREKLDLRTIRKIDELLNRISVGMLKNPAAQQRDSLTFCYEIIQDVYLSTEQCVKVLDDYKLKKYIIQKDAKVSSSRGSTTVCTYKLVRFALDVLRSILKNHDHLRTAPNLAGFIPILGDALVQAEEEIKVSAFKLLTTVVKVPLNVKDGSDLYKIAVTEAIKYISTTPATSDIWLAGLKLLSVILRDRSDVKIKDSSIDDLVEILRDTLTDTERRHVTFNFLRAVLDSKFESAPVYDTMDYVGSIMVTNDDKDTRDLARGAYFQFLREYPQKKSRWSKQLAFIVSNLKYEREGGRLSILEVIYLLICKSSNEFVQEVSATCFLPLVFVLMNDESEKCRTVAAEVIKEVFAKSDKERTHTFLALLRSWVKQTENPTILRLAFLTYGLYYEVDSIRDGNELAALLSKILGALTGIGQVEPNWELTYAALQLTATLCKKFPSLLLAADQGELWAAVRICLSFPHLSIRLSSARLFGYYFTDFARANIDNGLGNLPLRGSYGLEINADNISDLIRRTSSILMTPELTELLAAETVKNLVFLGQCAGTNGLKWNLRHANGTDDEEDNEDSDREDKGHQTVLGFLFKKLSFILRRDASPARAAVLIPKTAALELMQIFCSKLPVEKLSGSLYTILTPLHNLTDPSIPVPYSTDELFKTGYENLKSNSRDLMALLQSKFGTAEYTSELLRVRETVKARRYQRSAKRRIEAVTAPEKFGRDKRKKVERKKGRRKEKGKEHREQRQGRQ